MPTYTVTAPEGSLSGEQKQRIAAAITDTHCTVTAAPNYFAQVIFTDVKPGNYFIAGRPLAAGQIYVHGCIRAGRSADIKQRLLVGLMQAIAEVAALPRHQVWVYVAELPAKQIAELGHVLPEPGEEAAWNAALPAADRERMQALGRAGA